MSFQEPRFRVAAETTKQDAKQKVGSNPASALLALGVVLTLAWMGMLGTFAAYLVGLML
jgi:hypothetical protein